MTIRPALAFSLLSAATAAFAQTLPEVERSIVPVAAWGGTPAEPAAARCRGAADGDAGA